MRTSASFRLVVRFARRNTLFYDEDVTDLPRPVSAVYVGMKAMEIGRHGQHDVRRSLVRFSTELLNLYFQTRPQIWREQSYLYNELSSLSVGWGGRDRTSEWRNQNQFDYSTISRRIWKKGSKCPLAISIAWPPFPNEEAAVAGRISLAKSEATGCARADREGPTALANSTSIRHPAEATRVRR